MAPLAITFTLARIMLPVLRRWMLRRGPQKDACLTETDAGVGVRIAIVAIVKRGAEEIFAQAIFTELVGLQVFFVCRSSEMVLF